MEYQGCAWPAMITLNLSIRGYCLIPVMLYSYRWPFVRSISIPLDEDTYKSGVKYETLVLGHTFKTSDDCIIFQMLGVYIIVCVFGTV